MATRQSRLPVATPRPRSPLSLVVLSLCCEAPMHPYRMQQLIKQRGKDQIANVARGNSVYQTIAALQRAGHITTVETKRAAGRPDRTTYAATPQGREILGEWLRSALALPAREFPEFPAALSLVASLTPGELRAALETRMQMLQIRLAELTASYPGVPRLFLLEAEYMAAVARAELGWCRSVVDDLAKKRLTWSAAWLKRQAKALAAM